MADYSKPENSIRGGFVVKPTGTNVGGGAVEPPRADELSAPTHNQVNDGTEAGHLAMTATWTGPKDLRQRKGRKLKLASIGIPKHLLDQADPLYSVCLKDAQKYRKYRARELCVAHGYVSAGANALLSSAALALAASRFVYAKVAETGEIGLLKLASQLADSARQNELTAWEMAAREGTARKKAAMSEVGMPWLKATPVVERNPDGTSKRGPGRPRKAVLVAQATEEANASAGASETKFSGQDSLPEPGGDLASWVAGVASVDAGKANRGGT
jgi:hypothetical protein